jgi:CheY-like chemotaxis protein
MKTKGPIIIIDDDTDEQFLYQRALKKLNFSNEVVFFDKGEDAFEYLKQPASNPFLILSDINMPGMTGFELRELMCRDKNICKKKTPFIFISTSAMPSDLQKARELSTQGFFVKEISTEKYMRNLSSIIEYWSNASWINN